MAIADAIRRLIWQFTSTGADQVANEMNKVAEAQTTTEKSALNLDRQFQSLERRFSEAIRAEQDFAKVQAQVNAAVAQNPALMERGNAVLAAAAQRYEQLTRSQVLYAEAQRAIAAQSQMFASQLGGIGSALGGLGTVGLTVAAGVGAVAVAFKAASEQSHELGQKAIDLKKFADTTGLSTNQVQALRIEAGKLGIGSGEAEEALQKFTVSFEELRQGGGRALEVLRRYRPDLAEQMQQTESTARAIDLLAQAYQGLSVAEQNALSRSFFGRGGVDMGRLMQGLDLGASTQAFEASGRGLSEQQIETLRKLTIQNQELNRQWNEGFAKLFAPEILEAENKFLETLLQITKALKDIGGLQSALRLLPALPLAPAAVAVGSATWAGQHMFGPTSESSFVGPTKDMLAFTGPTKDMLKTAAPEGAETFAKQLKDAQDLVRVLGTLADTTEIVKAKQLELQKAYDEGSPQTRARIEELQSALEALIQIQAELAQVAPGTFERQLAALEELKAAYPGLTAAEAQRMQHLDQQLTLALAVTAQQRMAAQEAITFQNEINKGATVEQAAAVAAKERAITQAQINSQAQAQLAAMQDQFAVASAVTGVEKIKAQEAATYNALIRQGVDEGLAMQIALQQTANAYAQINAQAQAQLLTLQDQYAISAAVTGQERLQAQAQAAYNALIRQGVDEALAMRIVMQQMANAQAQINAGAMQRLLGARDQLAVASATTQQEKLAAQEIATTNQLIRQGVDAGLAAAVAAQERMNAEAQIAVQFAKQLEMAQAITGAQKIALMDTEQQAVAQAEVNANAERQLFSLNQQNELLIAQANHTEGIVRAQQAYVNAMREGVDETRAAALAAATLKNEQLKVAAAAEQAWQAIVKQAEAEAMAAEKAAEQAEDQEASAAKQKRDSAAQAYADQVFNAIKQLHDLGNTQFDYYTKYAIQLLPRDILDQVNRAIKATQEAKQKQEQSKSTQQQGEEELRQLQQQGREQGASSEEEKARIAAENKYQDLIRGGTEAGLARQIADQQLANALAELAKNTQANTSATSELTSTMESILSPYYATDPRLSHIGFRADSGKLDYDPFKLAASGSGSSSASSSTSASSTSSSASSSTSTSSTTSTPVSAQVNPGPYSTQKWPAGEVASTDPLGQYWNTFSASVVAPSWYTKGNYVDVSGQFIPLAQRTSEMAQAMAEGGILGPGGLAYVGEHGPNPGFIRAGSEAIMISPDDPRADYTLTGRHRDDRPIQIVQNFNAPISRDTIGEMKITAFQGAQSGMRQARMAGR